MRSLSFCEGTAPETSFSQPMLHDVSLVDVQTSSLTKRRSNTTRISFALQEPSQGLADTAYRKAKSTRLVALRRLSVRTLCMPFSAHVEIVTPIRHTKEDPVLPLGSTLATPFVTPGIMKRIFSAKYDSARHRFAIAAEYLTNQGRTGCPPAKSCPKRRTRQTKFVRRASFTSFTALSANPLLCESYKALSSVSTITPVNFGLCVMLGENARSRRCNQKVE